MAGKAETNTPVVRLENPVHDWNCRTGYLVHRDIARVVPFPWRVREEEQVPTMEGRLHRTAIRERKRSRWHHTKVRSDNAT